MYMQMVVSVHEPGPDRYMLDGQRKAVVVVVGFVVVDVLVDVLVDVDVVVLASCTWATSDAGKLVRPSSS